MGYEQSGSTVTVCLVCGLDTIEGEDTVERHRPACRRQRAEIERLKALVEAGENGGFSPRSYQRQAVNAVGRRIQAMATGGVPVEAGPVATTPCCGKPVIRKTDGWAVIAWNPGNGVVQCHACGATYVPKVGHAVPSENEHE